MHQLRSNPEEVLETAVACVEQAKGYCDDVEFSPMDATRTDIEYLYELLEATIEAGANTVNIPDTVGYAMPWEFGQRITDIRKNVPNIDRAVVSVHCHNDLGLSVASSLAAVKARRAPGRRVHKRAGGAGRQRVARRGHNEHRDAQGHAGRLDRNRYETDLPDQPARQRHHRVYGTAQQGDRGLQRVQARVGHSPGRGPEGEDDV